MTRAKALLLLFLAASMGCDEAQAVRAMPPGQLYFPTGMFFARPATAPEASGVLVVASSNFDRRYDQGRLTAIDVASLACGAAPAGACVPAFPVAPGQAPVEIASLGTIDEKGISSLAGEIDGVERPDGSFRVLVPSRAENSLLQAVDVSGAKLTCVGEGASSDCAVGATSLEANRTSSSGIPRAPAPFSVSISKPDGDAFVTSLQVADSPAASGQSPAAFMVRLNAFDPAVTNDNFLGLGTVPTESVVVGRRYAFTSGLQTLALRLIDRQSRQVINAFVESSFNLIEARGLALAGDESEAFLIARRPDALLVLSVSGPTSASPSLRLLHSELLPLGASQVRAIDSLTGGRVAVVTTVGTQSFDAVGSSQGTMLVWDDTSAKVVAELNGFGFQPYGLAVQRIGPGARLYVGLFGEGRIAVVDMPNLDSPEDIRLVARLGTSHVCAVNSSSRGCTTPNQ